MQRLVLLTAIVFVSTHAVAMTVLNGDLSSDSNIEDLQNNNTDQNYLDSWIRHRSNASYVVTGGNPGGYIETKTGGNNGRALIYLVGDGSTTKGELTIAFDYTVAGEGSRFEYGLFAINEGATGTATPFTGPALNAGNWNINMGDFDDAGSAAIIDWTALPVTATPGTTVTETIDLGTNGCQYYAFSSLRARALSKWPPP